ncbi:hypothetical protein C8J57DRAFT_1284256 [Mycena rebaudengoi]|nr:hypothetical protein C8J57DRAFT_1284256 [Mycena rebaudengoi]
MCQLRLDSHYGQGFPSFIPSTGESFANFGPKSLRRVNCEDIARVPVYQTFANARLVSKDDCEEGQGRLVTVKVCRSRPRHQGRLSLPSNFGNIGERALPVVRWLICHCIKEGYIHPSQIDQYDALGRGQGFPRLSKNSGGIMLVKCTSSAFTIIIALAVLWREPRNRRFYDDRRQFRTSELPDIL